MSQASARPRFIADLHSEASSFESFLELLRTEQAALADRDIDAVVLLAQSKSEHIASLNGLARRRNDYLRAQALTPDRAGMSQWLIAHGGAEQAALSSVWQGLLTTAAQAQGINRENGILIETRLQNNQRVLAALTSGIQPSLYGPDGQTRIAGSGRILGKV